MRVREHKGESCEICRDEGHFSLPQISTVGWKWNSNGIPTPRRYRQCSLRFSLPRSLSVSLPVDTMIGCISYRFREGQIFPPRIWESCYIDTRKLVSADVRLSIAIKRVSFVAFVFDGTQSHRSVPILYSESSSLPRSCVQKGGIKTLLPRVGEKEKRSGFVRERNSVETECISRMPNSVLQNQLRGYSLTLIKIFRREFSRGQYSLKWSQTRKELHPLLHDVLK